MKTKLLKEYILRYIDYFNNFSNEYYENLLYDYADTILYAKYEIKGLQYVNVTDKWDEIDFLDLSITYYPINFAEYHHQFKQLLHDIRIASVKLTLPHYIFPKYENIFFIKDVPDFNKKNFCVNNNTYNVVDIIHNIYLCVKSIPLGKFDIAEFDFFYTLIKISQVEIACRKIKERINNFYHIIKNIFSNTYLPLIDDSDDIYDVINSLNDFKNYNFLVNVLKFETEKFKNIFTIYLYDQYNSLSIFSNINDDVMKYMDNCKNECYYVKWAFYRYLIKMLEDCLYKNDTNEEDLAYNSYDYDLFDYEYYCDLYDDEEEENYKRYYQIKKKFNWIYNKKIYINTNNLELEYNYNITYYQRLFNSYTTMFFKIFNEACDEYILTIRKFEDGFDHDNYYRTFLKDKYKFIYGFLLCTYRRQINKIRKLHKDVMINNLFVYQSVYGMIIYCIYNLFLRSHNDHLTTGEFEKIVLNTFYFFEPSEAHELSIEFNDNFKDIVKIKDDTYYKYKPPLHKPEIIPGIPNECLSTAYTKKNAKGIYVDSFKDHETTEEIIERYTKHLTHNSRPYGGEKI